MLAEGSGVPAHRAVIRERVPEKCAGMRLDQALAQMLP